jgi:hypothetical protein
MSATVRICGLDGETSIRQGLYMDEHGRCVGVRNAREGCLRQPRSVGVPSWSVSRATKDRATKDADDAADVPSTQPATGASF